MIMGHVGFGGRFDYFIHAFHMPMFFLISGFLYRKSCLGLKEFISKKVFSLLVPYFFFGILYYVIWLIFFRSGDYLKPFLHLVFDNTSDLPIAGALWFLTALFFTDIFVYIISHRIKNLYLQILIVIILSLFGCLETSLLTYRLPFALGPSFVGLGLFYIGIFLRKAGRISYKLLNLNWGLIILVIPIEIFLIFLNGYINMRVGEYSNIWLFWPNAFISCLILINLSKKFEKYKRTSIVPSTIILILKNIGKNSISYVCFNQFVILICTFVVKRVFFRSDILFLIVSKIFILIMTISLIYFIDKTLRKTPLKRVLGIK